MVSQGLIANVNTKFRLCKPDTLRFGPVLVNIFVDDERLERLAVLINIIFLPKIGGDISGDRPRMVWRFENTPKWFLHLYK